MRLISVHGAGAGEQMIQSYFLYGYDIAPDGEKFIILEGDKPRTITVVLNWIEELKHKIQE